MANNILVAFINYNLFSITYIGCKIASFIQIFLGTLSPWCLVYISIDKFLSITFLAKRKTLKTFKNQLLFLIILFLIDFLYHLYIPLLFTLTSISELNSTYFVCQSNSYQDQIILAIVDSFFSFYLPFFLMICFSFLLISSIFRARSRIQINTSNLN